MNNEVFEQIRQFVIEERWECPMTFDTTLEGDLRITGDDADEFIIAFGKRFDVDVSDFLIIISDYFGGEGFCWLPESSKKPITLGDLHNAVLTGRLMDLSETFRQIIRFVTDWGLPGNVCRQTELYRHLKLRGGDALRFMDAFAEKFDVDASKFDFDQYFPEKGTGFLSGISTFLSRKKISLGDLEQAALKKKLV